MKKLALIFLMFLGLAGAAQSQQKDDDTILTMPVSAPCSPARNAMAELELKHGEYAFAQGNGIIWNSKIQEYIEVTTLIFLNPETFTFTIAFVVPEDDMICIMTLGDKFQPVRGRGNSL